jgi:hypothetical protein
MKKTALAVAAVSVFVLVDFAGSAVAAPLQIAPSISAGHNAVTTVAAKKDRRQKDGVQENFQEVQEGVSAP